MIKLKQKYDASTVAVMRQALNEVVTDRRFLVRKSVTPLEMAEHILQQAASGERDSSPRPVSQDANKKPALCPSSTGGKVVFRSMIELGQNRGGDVEPI